MYQGKRIAAVILSGGLGSGLWPQTDPGVQSKATLWVAGKRLIYFNADRIEDAGLKHLFVTIQEPYDDEIERKVKFDNYGFETSQFERPKNKEGCFTGTAESVLHIRKLKDFEYVLIVPCDHITNVDYTELIERAIFNHEKYGAVMTTAAIEKNADEIRGAFGNPKLDEYGKVIQWVEKPKEPISPFAALGIYAGPTIPILKAIEKGGNDFGNNVLRYLRREGLLYCHYFPGGEFYWNDAGNKKRLLEAAKDLREGGKTKNIRIPYIRVSMKTVFGGTIEDCLVSPKETQPRVFGTARRSVIAPNSTVDEGVTVEDSILMGDLNLKVSREKGHVAIERSVIGRYSMISNTDLKDISIGKRVIMHGCSVVKPDIGIRSFAELYDDQISADVRREDAG